MNECEHKTATIQADHANVTIGECDWDCGAIIISVTDYNGISHAYTAEELATLRERLAAVEAIFSHFGGLEVLAEWENADGESVRPIVDAYRASATTEGALQLWTNGNDAIRDAKILDYLVRHNHIDFQLYAMAATAAEEA